MFVTRMSHLARRCARSSLARATRVNHRKARALLHLEALEARTLLSLASAELATATYQLHRTDDSASPLTTSGPTGYSPTQVSHAYGFDQIHFANNPLLGTGTTIAIVDAYDDPNIANDLHQFDLAFNLPDPPSFTKMNQSGGTTSFPAANGGWITEIALDVEWAHAIAPGASILLVEANDNSNSNLYAAVDTARKASGVVAVSMSWGGSESSNESSLDSHFTTPSGHTGVTFVSSAGDTGAPASYPSASVNVVSVGGTTLNLSQNNYGSESAWSGSGGGVSADEPQPAYQKGVVTQSTTKRATPDVAYDADPSTGFPVYDSYNNGTTKPWGQWGGTSDAAPQWAALIAIADQGRRLAGLGTLDGPSQTLPMLYSLPSSDYHDITTGASTGTPNLSAGVGYDLVTGLGTPYANLVVNGLIGVAPTVATPAAASPGTVAGTTAALSVLGSDPTYAESALSYSWTAPSVPPGAAAPTFSGNGTNAAKNTTATFYQAGSYTLLVTIADPGNLTATSSVVVTVNQTLTTITVAPANTTLANGATQSFTATASDQFAQVLATQPVFTWSVAPGGAGGTVTATGLYTAPAAGTGSDTVQVMSGAVSGTASVTVAAAAAGLSDAGFESPSLGTGNFQYDPTGTPWSYSGSAGVTSNGTGFSAGNPPAPQGVQVAFIQAGGAFSQVVNGMTAGSYVLSFDAAQRGNYGTSREDFEVLVDGTVVGTFTPTGTSYAVYTTVAFTVTAGAHTITFQGLDSVGGDNTALLDAVNVNPTVSGPTVATPAAASPGTVAGTTAALSVLGSDPTYSESALSYSWTASSVPPSGRPHLQHQRHQRRQEHHRHLLPGR